MPKRKTSRARKTPAQVAAIVAQVAATEYMSLWGEPAHLPADALPALPQPRAKREPKPKPVGNPCVALYGPDAQGRKCKSCAHLCYFEQSSRWYKCDLRKFTHGPGSDHRVNWPACAKYESRATDDVREAGD
jgi:hypothetical protein